MKVCELSKEELSTVVGGQVCSIFDIGCIGGESLKWALNQLPKRNGPLNCVTVGVTAYTCH